MRTPFGFVAASFLTLALGCSDGTGPRVDPPPVQPGPPARVTTLTGDGQQGIAGGAVADSLAIRVTDADGKPVSGAAVTWAAGSGGSVSPASVRTNAAGEAKTAWTLGPAAGEQTASATVTGVPAASFRATATAGAPSASAKVRGDSQTGEAGTPLPDSLVVRVTDVNGNPVAGAAVTWAAGSGGSVSPASVRTNAAGDAKTAWTLGTTAGEHTATAAVAGSPGQVFAARATPGAAARLDKAGGDGQTGTTGAVLADPLAVRVSDAFGNLVPGATVAWQASGGGQITPATSAANAEGVARASWTLGGTIGGQSATASAAGVASPANFAATAEPADPGRADPIRLVSGTTVGKPTFPLGDTPQGGQGQPVGGLSCIETIAYHVHAHVSLFVEGVQIAIPAAIGIVDPVVRDGYAGGGSCFYWLHTHDATGIVHVEPPTQEALTLGQLFAVWGQPLESDNVAGFRGPVTVYVDGVRFRGDPRTVPFASHREITLQVGTPLAPLPSYIYPDGL